MKVGRSFFMPTETYPLRWALNYKIMFNRKEYNRIWWENNPNYNKNYHKNWLKTEKGKLYLIKKREYKKEWRKKNPNKMKEYRQKRKDKIGYCASHQMSSHIWETLKGKKNRRSWQKLVGYTTQDLIKHLENLFDKNMNWNNYGSYWHIDHIKPQSLFNYIYPEDPEFKECWALNNLQPLEAKENIRKSNRFIN